jgi:hypothetical protein
MVKLQAFNRDGEARIHQMGHASVGQKLKAMLF